MIKVFKFIALLLVATVTPNRAENGETGEPVPEVTLFHGGSLIGSYMETTNGNKIKAFRGIPYAEPPVGDLRFKPPLPAKTWRGKKLANEDQSMCPCQNAFERNFKVTGDEDCLYLNVYIPAEKTDRKLFSVMVWFHGGGWMTGTGNSYLYGPQRLLDHNIILVTGNYRLGAFGFLSTLTEDCPGNYGLKDQLLMLKWVKENIETFGGNSSDVTIFGQSAGGASVGLHMFSHLSKGLFHKAILQSGTPFGEWAMGDESFIPGRAEKFGQFLNCFRTDESWEPFVDCLRMKSAYDIAATLPKLFEYDIDPSLIFPAVVEPEIEGAFLTEHPRKVKIAPSNTVPVMVGITGGEGAMKSGPLLNLRREDFTSRFREVIPIILFYQNRPEHIQNEITERLDEFYFKGEHNWSKDNHLNLTNLITDSCFTWGLDRFLRSRFAATSEELVAPTYVYIYDHRGPVSMSEFFYAGPEYYGVCHTDELPYLFIYRIPDVHADQNDTKMKWAMPYMWANFAKTGNPTPESSEIPEWIPADKFPLNYALIGRKTEEDWTILSNEEGLMEDRVQFWRGIEDLDPDYA